VAADDLRHYWVKVLGNPQGDQILATERIVSAVGTILGAPVRPTALVTIPKALAGYQYGEWERLQEGVGHGSLHLMASEENDTFIDPKRDGNSARQPRAAGLWDLCMGEDEQWLYDHESDRAMWSFDHGNWLGGETGWTGAILAQNIERPWGLSYPERDLSAIAFLETAKKMEELTPKDLLSAVATVPPEWGVADSELETVAWVLYRRRTGVAARLRGRASRLGMN